MGDASQHAGGVLTMDGLGQHSNGATHRTARRQFIAGIQQAELAHEKALLDHILIPSKFPLPPLDENWHGLDFYGVTDRLRHICVGSASFAVRTTIQQKHNNQSWLKESYLGAPGDQAAFQELDGEKDCRSEGLKRMGDMFDAAGKGTKIPEMIHTYRLLRRRGLFAILLTQARRFTDTRNPEIKQRTLPDGSNLENDDLRIAWVTYRTWVRLLHYRSLRIGDDDLFGATQLQDLLRCSMYQYYKEMGITEYTPNDWTNSDVLEFGLGRKLWALYKKLALVADGLSGQEGNERLKAELVEAFITNGEENIEDDLYGDLLALSFTFEDQQVVEHVEDTLVDRRIVETDEWTRVYDLLRSADNSYTPGLLEKSIDKTGPSREMRNILRRTTEVNQLRRNYRLLRDWSGRRPWKQLYYVFDTSDGGDRRKYRRAIAEFYLKIRLLQASPDPDLASDSPSQKANIFSHLFVIHPIATTEPHVPYFDKETGGTCIICMDEYKPHDVLIALPCDHLFHFSCIRNSWDTETLYAKKCVLCRQTAPSLYAIAGITPEVIDVWDSVAVNGVDNPFYPDIPNVDTGYFQDNELLDASDEWDDPNSQNYGRPRSAWTEMARLRRRRQKENVRRRAKEARSAPRFPPHHVTLPQPHLEGGAAAVASANAAGVGGQEAGC